MNERATYTIRGVECVPVDRDAARVVRAGVSFKSSRVGNSAELGRDTVATTTPPPGVEDLRGQVRGRMAIVGYLERRLSTPRPDANGTVRKKDRWLARCACGRLEVRRGLSWRRGVWAGTPDYCEECKHLDYLRKISGEAATP